MSSEVTLLPESTTLRVDGVSFMVNGNQGKSQSLQDSLVSS